MVILGVIFLFTGACSIFTTKSTETISLPEHIYKRPSDDLNRDVVIGVFKFWSPDYTPHAGYSAADILYKDLLNRGFRNVVAEYDAHDMRFENIMEIAGKRNYELIITGDVTYYSFGDALQESRVDEEIRVTDALTGETVWFAEVVEIGAPVAPKDLLFFLTPGEAAPSAAMLMRKNARKITNMFLSLSEEQEHIAKEMKSVNDGYNYLVDKKYDKAKFCFEEAIKINPNNSYALYNLGLVYEKQGNKKEAIMTYKKIVEKKPQIKTVKYDDPGGIGNGLVDLAMKRLKRLDR
jgi:tetratricopeptide (TPR) repeat protein